MKKFLLGVVLSVLLISNSAFAMTFQQPVKVGSIGWGPQSPLYGLPITGATYNDGITEPRDTNRVNNAKKHGINMQTYIKGTARFGEGENALYCKYDASNKKIQATLNFGGKNNYVLFTNPQSKDILMITTNERITLYAIYHNYCVTDLKILGKQKSGKWVVYIDSKKISDKYFGGKDSYKEEGGVLYDVPTCEGDTLVVQYRRWHWSNTGGISDPEGEFRFKWDERAQWFSVEQVIY